MLFGEFWLDSIVEQPEKSYPEGQYVVAVSSDNTTSAKQLAERTLVWSCGVRGPFRSRPDKIKIEIRMPIQLLVLAATLDREEFAQGPLPIGFGT